MNILVTGGAGYVGSHASRKLQQAGHNVWVYDNLSRGHRAAALPGRLIVGDLHNGNLLSQVMRDKEIEAVLHFAAFIEVGESVKDPGRYYRNNFVATLSLLEAMRLADVKRIVFSSTAATYGQPKCVPIPEHAAQEPINPYGFTKLAIEKSLSDYAAAYGLGFAALRYFNACGASPAGEIGEDHQPETHLIPLVLQVALGQRECISMFGNEFPTPDGTCVRDYVHVDDLADAHVLALDKIKPGEGIHLNLGTGRGFSVKEVIEACRRVTGHDIPARIAGPREGDPPTLVADSRKAQGLLGWQPHYTSLDEIVETAWRWHYNHPQGYAELDDAATTAS